MNSHVKKRNLNEDEKKMMENFPQTTLQMKVER